MGVLADPWDTVSLQQSSGHETTGRIVPTMSLLSTTAGQNKQQGLSLKWRPEMGHFELLRRLIEFGEVIFIKKSIR